GGTPSVWPGACPGTRCPPGYGCDGCAGRALRGQGGGRALPGARGAVKTGRSEHRQVAAQFVLGDLAAVLLPLLALVPQEEVEDVLPQRLGDQLAVLHRLDGLVQV